MLILNVLLLLVGFVLLIKGADFFVDGASSVAKLIGVPSIVIGLTIVAMGTSAPEAAVSITAGLAGSNEIAISNVIGSNTFNLLVVCGVCALIKPYAVDKVFIKRDFPVNIAATVILLAMISMGGIIGRLDGAVLLALMASYIIYLVVSAIKNRETAEDEVKALSPVLSVLFIIGGLAAVIFGGDLVVDNAVVIAKAAGWSETFIGLTIIAIGTSLPELVTSIVAARKGDSGLALGNVVGSNVFNLMFILGLSGSINAITINDEALINIIILLAVTLFVTIACSIKQRMSRATGGICVALYIAYTVYLLIVG